MIVVFDLDGTLYQTKNTIIHAIHLLFDELGIAHADEQSIANNIGKPTNDFLSSILPASINPNHVRERFRELEQNVIRTHATLFLGVEEMLAELVHRGQTLLICSNGSTEYIDLVVSVTGIKHYFNKIYSSKYHCSKAELIKELVGENDDIVIIGDTLFDIEAAIGNNIPSIAVTYGYGNKDDLMHATFRADTASEIMGYISQIEIFHFIVETLMSKSKKIIGINGVDASGKTTFTNHFSSYLTHTGIKNQVLHMDDFHNPIAVRSSGDNEIDAYYYNAFNYDQVIEEILSPLRSGLCIEKDIFCLNLESDIYDRTIHFSIDKDTILLIEGVLIFRPPLLEYFDVKIFLDIRFDKVMERVKIRDIPIYGEAFLQKYVSKYIPIQKRYLSEHDPKEISDIVINNEDFQNPKFEA